MKQDVKIFNPTRIIRDVGSFRRCGYDCQDGGELIWDEEDVSDSELAEAFSSFIKEWSKIGYTMSGCGKIEVLKIEVIKEPLSKVETHHRPDICSLRVVYCQDEVLPTFEQKSHQTADSGEIKALIRRIAEEENYPNPEYLIKLAFCESSLK